MAFKRLQHWLLAMLEEKNNKRIDYGYVNYLDHEEKRVIKINPFLRAEVNELVRKVKFLLRSKQVPEKIKNQNKCKACGLMEKCFDDEIITTKLREINEKPMAKQKQKL